MKECFTKLSMRIDSLDRIETINKIVDEYITEGYKLTLRQLYYQLVSRDIIPNKQAEYAKLSVLLKKGRMAGLVDFAAIEDRTRRPQIPFSARNPKEAIEIVADQYRVNRQIGQPKYIEVWCEKDAISNVLLRVTEKYHIKLMVNRGYSSCSSMYDAHNRIDFDQNDHPEGTVILYLGDFDSSGLDMIRDIDERLTEFNTYIDIEHIALTQSQIERYDPPPNPAKMTDPRAANYVEKHGKISWEIDALNPSILNQTLTDAIEKHLDLDQFNHMLKKEESDKQILAEVIKNLDKDDD